MRRAAGASGVWGVQAHDLNEVYCGGLSSYAVTWTLVAHLLQEGFPLADPQATAGQLPIHILPAYHLLPPMAFRPDMDLGALLHGFLLRFGSLFNPEAEAVSVLQVRPQAKAS